MDPRAADGPSASNTSDTPKTSVLRSRSGRVAVVLAAAALALVAASVLGFVGAPGVTEISNRIVAVDNDTTTIETNVTVRNPNPLGVSIDGATIDYGVRMNDVPMASNRKNGLRIGRGNSTLSFRTEMRNERISEWWVTHVENGERTTLRVDADAGYRGVEATFEGPTVEREIQTDIVSAFNSTETRAIDANQPLVSDPILYVNETSAQWGDANESATPIRTSFVVYNPKPVPVTVSRLGYDIHMNGVRVGRGSTNREYVVGPKQTQRIEATAVIENDRLDEWWVTHVRRGEVTTLTIDFRAVVRLPAGVRLDLPLQDVQYTQTIETSVFGTETNVGQTNSGQTNGGESAGGDTEPTAGSSTTEHESRSTGDGTQSPENRPASAGALTRPTETLPAGGADDVDTLSAVASPNLLLPTTFLPRPFVYPVHATEYPLSWSSSSPAMRTPSR
ncbi:LEA type 2 family protein [Haloprofundus salinisoli]|uniref:LEA type 2 family protein n=1 Tax=Haloprofundus salinisoli TaxID=2876193 RepID=UPI001CCB1E42|nr:LEA type 2 family protein [Haloprofundus salinisoli]